MDPEKRKKRRRRHEEWLQNDPLNRRLRERIRELDERIAARKGQARRRKSS
jgi:hypothetical protein